MPLLVSVTTLASMPLHLFLPALPLTATQLLTSPGIIQLTITLYMVGLAVGQPLYGPLSDRYGRRPVLMAGLLLFVLSSIFAAFAATAGTLIVARVFQALGACGGMVIGRAMVRDGTTPEKAAGTMATLGVSLTIAPAIAPAIGAYLTEWVGWRPIFGVLAGVGATLLILTALTLPETHLQCTNQLGFTRMLRNYRKLIRIPQFLGYALAGSISSVLFAYLAVLPFMIVDVLQRPLHEVGPCYLLIVVGNAIGSYASSRLVHRLGSHRIARLGMHVELTSALLLLLVHIAGGLSVATFIGPAMLLAIGVGLVNPNCAANSVSADPASIGAASGLYGSMQLAFGALCTIVVGAWHGASVLPLAIVMVFSALIGQSALTWAVRRR